MEMNTKNSLLKLCKYYISRAENTSLPKNYQRFRILNPEYSVSEVEVKPYPVPETEHLFALIWDILPSHCVEATIIPSIPPCSYHRDFTPGIRTQMHSHEYLELFYIIDGEYKQHILGNEFTFHQGELCLIDRNCQHQELLGSHSATLLFLGITNIMFEDIMKRNVTTERITSFLNMALMQQKSLQQYIHFKPQSQTAARQMEASLLQLLEELDRHDEASPLICQGLLLRIMRILSTQYDFSLSRQQRKQMNYLLFEEITDYMLAHLNRLSTALLAEEFHFQEDYFNRLIKAQSGLTYTEYLQLLRLRKAEELLTHTDKTIEKIAEEVGYHNKGYFYKIFLEKHHLTPAQYRRTQR